MSTFSSTPITLLIAGLIFFIAGSTQAQEVNKKVTTQKLMWTIYNLKHTFDDDWTLSVSMEERFYVNPVRQHQWLVVNRLGRKISPNWKATLGFTYFIQTLPHDPESEETFSRLELRPHQIFTNVNQYSDRFRMAHRYNLEQRFIQKLNEQGEYGENGYELLNWRFRYRLLAFYELDEHFTLKAGSEVMLNLGPKNTYNVFDQNRAFLSVLYDLSPKFRMELGYINWYQQRSSGNAFFNRHILQVVATQKI